MKQLNSYIIEKLKIDKEVKTGKIVPHPSNKEEFLDMIDKYYREWYEWDNEHDYHTKGKPINEKYYKQSIDYIKKLVDERSWVTAEYELPVKFLKYMNKFHGMNYKIKD